MRARAAAVAAALLAARAGAVLFRRGGVEAAVHVRGAVRQGAGDGLWPSLDGTYTSVFRWNDNAACPGEVVIRNNFALDKDNVASVVDGADFVEDGQPCSGATLFSQSVPFLLTEAGRAQMREQGLDERLARNEAAEGSLEQFTNARLGYDSFAPEDTERVRRCGDKVYGDDTFWYSIPGGDGNKVTMGAVSGTQTTTEFQEGTKGLFVSLRRGLLWARHGDARARSAVLTCVLLFLLPFLFPHRRSCRSWRPAGASVFCARQWINRWTRLSPRPLLSRHWRQPSSNHPPLRRRPRRTRQPRPRRVQPRPMGER